MVSEQMKENLPEKRNPLFYSKKISELREHLGLSQAAFGKMLGVSGASIGQLERGESKSPSADLLGALASMLSVNLDWFLNDEGKMFKPTATQAPSEDKTYKIPASEEAPHIEESAASYRPGPTPTVTHNGKTVPTLNLTNKQAPADLPGTDLVRQVAKNTREIELLQQALQTVIAEVRQLGARSS